MKEPRIACTTCFGSGEIASDLGPEVCPDCQGDLRRPGERELLEWRLRDIERVHVGEGHPCEPDIRWLVHQVRQCRRTLVQVLSRCQDAEDDVLARELRFMVNEALELYEPVPSRT